MNGPPSASRSGAPSRVRVWADDLPGSMWVLLPRAARTVRDVSAALAAKLGLGRAPAHYDLFMGDALVLPSEDARLLRDGDEVAIRNKRPAAAPAAPAASKKARLDARPASAAPAPHEQHLRPPLLHPTAPAPAAPAHSAPRPRPPAPVPRARQHGPEIPPRREQGPVPAPVHAAPAAAPPRQPAPAQPAPAQPAPTQPAPTQPAPTQPAAQNGAPVNAPALVRAPPVGRAGVPLRRSEQETPAAQPTARVAPVDAGGKRADVDASFSTVTASANGGEPPVPERTPVKGAPVLQSKPVDRVKPGAKKSPAAKDGLPAPQPSASKTASPLPPKPKSDPVGTSSVPHYPRAVGDPVFSANVPGKGVDAGGTSRVPQHSKAVGDPVLSETVSAKGADKGNSEMPKRSSEPPTVEKNEKSVSHENQRPYKKPDKPTNIYTAGRSYPADRDRNARRDRDIGGDGDAERNYNVDGDRNVGRDGNAGWNYNADRDRNGGRDRSWDRNFNADRGRNAGRDRAADRNYYTDGDLNAGRDRDVEMKYGPQRNRNTFRGRDPERNYNADRAFNSGRNYGRNRDYNADRDYYGEREYSGDRNYRKDRNRDTERGYNAERDYNPDRDYDNDEDRDRRRAVQERQYNESFHVGQTSKPKKAPEETTASKDKNDGNEQEMKTVDELDDTAVEETKKELEALFKKDKPGKLEQSSTTKDDPNLKAFENVPDDLVCENTVTDGSCTILDMLKGGNTSPGDDDAGLYCRVQVLLGFGTLQTSDSKLSPWIRLLLAPRPTDKNELRISKVSAEALAVLRRSGNAAKQRSPGTAMVRRGANLKENLPILLNPNAIHKFSFDISSLNPDDSLLTQPKVDDRGGKRDEKAVVKKEPDWKIAAGPSLPKRESVDSEPKTGYENLAQPLTDQNRKHKPATEQTPIALDQIPMLDELPGAAADFQAELEGGAYPPLEAVDSVLDTLDDMELNTSTVGNAQPAAPRQAQSQVKAEKPKRKEPIIPRDVPVPSLSGIARSVPGPSRVQPHTIPARNMTSPDSVIDLVEDTGDEEISKRKESTTFTSDYRSYMLNVMSDITSTLKTLTAREDMHLRRFSVL